MTVWGEKTVEVDLEAVRVMANSSLRYALGRATYITGLTADILKTLPEEVWDERTLSVAIEDLKWYFDDREKGFKPDMDCDYEAWKELYDWLMKKCYEKGEK